MKTYTARARANSSALITLTGNNLVDAIEQGWNRIKPYIKGNAAGATVTSVTLEVEAHKYTTCGGKNFARLVIRAKGGELPHMVDNAVYETRFDFEIKKGEEKDHTFELTPPAPRQVWRNNRWMAAV